MISIEEILAGIEQAEGCHPINIGRKDKDGYQILEFQGRLQFVHRLVADYYKVDGEGPLVRHLCNNRNCGNPAHLRYGTHKENVRDMIDAGNAKWTPKKLTADKVIELRRLYEVDGIGKLELARRFDMSPRQVRDIINRVYWKHV